MGKRIFPRYRAGGQLIANLAQHLGAIHRLCHAHRFMRHGPRAGFQIPFRHHVHLAIHNTARSAVDLVHPRLLAPE